MLLSARPLPRILIPIFRVGPRDTRLNASAPLFEIISISSGRLARIKASVLFSCLRHSQHAFLLRCRSSSIASVAPFRGFRGGEKESTFSANRSEAYRNSPWEANIELIETIRPPDLPTITGNRGVPSELHSNHKRSTIKIFRYQASVLIHDLCTYMNLCSRKTEGSHCMKKILSFLAPSCYIDPRTLTAFLETLSIVNGHHSDLPVKYVFAALTSKIRPLFSMHRSTCLLLLQNLQSFRSSRQQRVAEKVLDKQAAALLLGSSGRDA